MRRFAIILLVTITVALFVSACNTYVCPAYVEKPAIEEAESDS